MRFLLSMALLVSLLVMPSLPGYAQNGFVRKVISNDLDPVSMTMADDGRIFIAEKRGVIKIMKDEVIVPEPFLTISVDNFVERGISGIALDPDFGSNGYFYVFYTVPGKNHNRVSRFKSNGNTADPSTEEILIEIDPMTGVNHNGGAMLFGHDKKLYISTGDGSNSSVAQNLNSLLGKMLRINTDGSIPNDNPFYSSTTGKYRSIFAVGFRNPFTMAKNPVNGRIFVNDVGLLNYEEINELFPGKNYGWPVTEGYLKSGQTPPDNYQDPLYAYDHSGFSYPMCAITGGAFYFPEHESFPSQYHGKYIFVDYCSGLINYLDIDTKEVGILVPLIYRPIAPLVAHDGSLYCFSRWGVGGGSDEDNTSTSEGELLKITYTGDGQPYIFKQPESQVAAIAEVTTFTVEAGGEEPIYYQWQKDGVDITGAQAAELSYVNTGLSDHGAQFTCKITNGYGSIVSNPAQLNVTSNTRPSLVITHPSDQDLYQAGDTLTLKGIATDLEDGTLAAGRLSWKIDFHHDTHIHPAMAWTNGFDSTGFIIPKNTETAPNVWYRVYLKATDSENFSKTIYKEVYPLKSQITLSVNKPGIQLSLDGKPLAMPYQFESVVGVIRSLSAPTFYTVGDSVFKFKEWKNSIQENSFNFDCPDKDSVFTAIYTGYSLDNYSGLTTEMYNQNQTFTFPPDLVRIDSMIDFSWAGQSPEPDLIKSDTFTLRWSGYLKVPFEETYTFYLDSDDGSRLWIDNQLIIDNWGAQAGTEKQGTKALSPNRLHQFKIEYFEKSENASIRLSWSSPSLPKSVIDKAHYFLINPANTPPIISFAGIDEDFRFANNQLITITGNAVDAEDHDLDPKAFSWRIDKHHHDHVHRVIPPREGIKTIQFSTHLDDPLEADIWYRIYLTVTDSEGASATDTLDVFPKVAEVNLHSNLPGLDFRWNDETFTAPHTLNMVEGSTHSVSVPSRVKIQDDVYAFSAWNGGSSNNSISFTGPASDTTLSAFYQHAPDVSFTAPSAAFRFIAGQNVIVKGIANDFEDGALDNKSFRWKVELRNPGQPAEPSIADATGLDSLVFQPPLKVTSDAWYRVYLTVTDSEGVSATDSLDIYPSLIEVQLTSNIDNVTIELNDVEITLPAVVHVVQGAENLAVAPLATSADDEVYKFQQWEHDGAIGDSPTFIVTQESTTLEVRYVTNKAPQLAFSEDAAHLTFAANNKITVKGTAIDPEDGPLPASNLQWKAELRNHGTFETVFETSGVDSLGFHTLTENFGQDALYRISLTASDADGKSSTIYKDILPNVVKISLTSNIPNIPFTWNGEALKGTVLLKEIEGTSHMISAPLQLTQDGLQLSFEKWEDGPFTNSFIFSVPEADTVLTAVYQIITGLSEATPDVKVYPNPVTSILIIERSPNQTIATTYEILNPLGHSIISYRDVRTDIVQIDLGRQSAGIYFLKILQGSTSRIIKVIKQ